LTTAVKGVMQQFSHYFGLRPEPDPASTPLGPASSRFAAAESVKRVPEARRISRSSGLSPYIAASESWRFLHEPSPSALFCRRSAESTARWETITRSHIPDVVPYAGFAYVFAIYKFVTTTGAHQGAVRSPNSAAPRRQQKRLRSVSAPQPRLAASARVRCPGSSHPAHCLR
jgi:hypothetical protein